MRSAGIISALLLAVVLGTHTQARANESIICKSVSHCVNIVERHAPDSFDYQVLNGEFQRFGQKGKTALLNMLASKNETDMRRAQAVLARGQTLLTPNEQRKVAALWPRGDLKTHAKIMKSALSPLMRARVIETLSHENPEVRKLSREIIAATVERKMDFPLRPEDYGRLAKGLLDDPSPALVELISTFDIARTKPVFLRLLKSTDGPTLNAAYEKLYAHNPEEAFKALVATLYDLEDNQSEAAFAISHALRQRHTARQDGFYLNFAKDLTEDPEMSLMGRLAGFDALMQSEAAPKLSEPGRYENVIKSALSNHGVLPTGYLRNLPRQAGDTSDAWLTAYWEYFRSQASDQKLDFIRLVGGFDTDVAKNILVEALGDKGDWRIIQSAALPLGRLKHKAASPKLRELSEHPIMTVQIAALTALDGINKGSMKGRTNYWTKLLSNQKNYCAVKSIDFKSEASKLPFFENGKVASYSVRVTLRDGRVLPTEITRPARRKNLTSSSASLNGYLAGYSNGEFGGGLVYYDNASGDSQLVLRNQVIAILPVKKLPLGQFPNEFWVFTNSDDNGIESHSIYRVSIGKLSMPSLHAALPSQPLAITQIDDSSIVMSFGDSTNVNPPLLLSPTGAIRRACSAPADTANALP